MNTRLDLIKDDLSDILLLINGESLSASGVFTEFELLLLVTYMVSYFFLHSLKLKSLHNSENA